MASKSFNHNNYSLFLTPISSYTVLTATAAFLLLFGKNIHLQLLRHFHKKYKKLPPGNFGLPIFGHTLSLLLTKVSRKYQGRLGDFLLKKESQYGELYITSIPLFSSNCIVVNSYEAVRFILSRENRGVMQKWPEAGQLLFGKYALTKISGKMHKRLRSQIMPIFQTRYLERYAIQISNIVNTYLKQNWKCGKDVVVNDELKSIIYAINANIILGLDESIKKDKVIIDRIRGIFILWVNGLFLPVIRIPGSPFTKANKACKELVSIISELVQKRRNDSEFNFNDNNRSKGCGENHNANSKTNTNNQGDMLSLLLQAKVDNPNEKPTYLTNEEIVDTLMSFIFAASDPTSCNLSWIVKIIGENQDTTILQKLKTEHQGIVNRRKERLKAKQSDNSTNNNGDDNHNNNNDNMEILTYEEIESASFTKKFINESNRLQILIGVLRRVADEDLYYKDYIIPKGWNILVDIVTMTRNAKHFPSPENFDTDRSYDKGFLPFGYGLRKCIGHRLATIEMITIIHYLVIGYEWEISPNARSEVNYFPMRVMKDGIPIKITKEL